MVSTAWEAGDRPHLSVVIASQDRAGFLPELFAALEAQTIATAGFEVVVADDGSTDGTWDALGELAAKTSLRVLAGRGSERRGQAHARNCALSFVRSPHVVFTDDDCLPEPGWLAAMQRSFRAGAEVVQGRTLPHEASRPAAGHWGRTIWVTRPSGLFETCNVGYRRSTLEAAGGFPAQDPLVEARNDRTFGEDALLGARVVDSGASVAFAPDAVVRHRYVPGSYVDWLRELQRSGRFPALARRSPPFRSQLIGGVFLSPATAAADLAVAATLTAVARRRVWPLLGVVPWLLVRWPEARHRAGGRPPAARYPQVALADAVVLVSLIRGSIRHRRLVL